jgi:hypothetical protein
VISISPSPDYGYAEALRGMLEAFLSAKQGDEGADSRVETGDSTRRSLRGSALNFP